MVQVSYPGVYIEEVPSGVRTITGVATSITAFIGRALRGSTDEPVIINSFADYERMFGGLWADSMMSYAIRDFYQNGGSQAIIVRLFEPLFADETARVAAWAAAKLAAEGAAGAVASAASSAVPSAADVVAAAKVAKDAAVAVYNDANTASQASGATAADVTGAAQDAVPNSGSDGEIAAAQGVADAAYTAANIPGASVADVVAAAKVAKDAAVAVYNDANTASQASGATAADVTGAAQDAVPNSGSDGEIAAAQGVADAAQEAAGNPQDIVDAAQAAADGYSNGPDANGAAEYLAAQAVAKTAQDALDADSSLTYKEVADAANDVAMIDVAVQAAADTVVPVTKAQLVVGNLTLEASSPGKWSSNLKASVNYDTKDPDDTKLFNLVVYEGVDGGSTEAFLNVSVDVNDPRYLPRVLEHGSMLVRVLGNMPDARPAATLDAADVSATGGSDGAILDKDNYLESESNKTGIYALKKADLFNLLCIPPATRGNDTDAEVYQKAMKLCVDERAMLIVDPPAAWGASAATAAANAIAGLGGLGLTGVNARNAALYFPRVQQPDPKRDGQVDTFVPCGIIAGLIASTDSSRGVWKAPAGLDAALQGIYGLQVKLTDAENGQLNPLGINCLRTFPVNGRVVWGARTLRGADQMADEYKYVPVRRLALFLEESLFRGTQWVVFEPNDEPLWSQIRLNLGAFMHNLFRQGAFQGSSPREAYFVKCDKETTTQNDIDLGIVNIVVGFAPLKPAEFVVIKLQQIAGQIQA